MFWMLMIMITSVTVIIVILNSRVLVVRMVTMTVMVVVTVTNIAVSMMIMMILTKFNRNCHLDRYHCYRAEHCCYVECLKCRCHGSFVYVYLAAYGLETHAQMGP